jgi:hypothetical protein
VVEADKGGLRPARTALRAFEVLGRFAARAALRFEDVRKLTARALRFEGVRKLTARRFASK